MHVSLLLLVPDSPDIRFCTLLPLLCFPDSPRLRLPCPVSLVFSLNILVFAFIPTTAAHFRLAFASLRSLRAVPDPIKFSFAVFMPCVGHAPPGHLCVLRFWTHPRATVSFLCASRTGRLQFSPASAHLVSLSAPQCWTRRCATPRFRCQQVWFTFLSPHVVHPTCPRHVRHSRFRLFYLPTVCRARHLSRFTCVFGLPRSRPMDSLTGLFCHAIAPV